MGLFLFFCWGGGGRVRGFQSFGLRAVLFRFRVLGVGQSSWALGGFLIRLGCGW